MLAVADRPVACRCSCVRRWAAAAARSASDTGPLLARRTVLARRPPLPSCSCRRLRAVVAAETAGVAGARCTRSCCSSVAPRPGSRPRSWLRLTRCRAERGWQASPLSLLSSLPALHSGAGALARKPDSQTETLKKQDRKASLHSSRRFHGAGPHVAIVRCGEGRCCSSLTGASSCSNALRVRRKGNSAALTPSSPSEEPAPRTVTSKGQSKAPPNCPPDAVFLMLRWLRPHPYLVTVPAKAIPWTANVPGRTI